MQKQNLTPRKSFRNKHRKDKRFQTQFKQTFEGFYKLPQSMKELSVLIQIDRSNICRYCDKMRKAGLIAVFKKGECKITKRVVNKYTTNPRFFPINSQLKLF